MYPPVHMNLSLYKRLLKNIPLRSAEEYQHFLDATSDSHDSSLSGGNTGPLNSTQDAQGHGRSYFWRPLATRKSHDLTKPDRSCSIELKSLKKLSRGTDKKTGFENQGISSSTASVPQTPPSTASHLPSTSPNVLVHAPPADLNGLLNENYTSPSSPSDLNEILTEK